VSIIAGGRHMMPVEMAVEVNGAMSRFFSGA
jgi:hypothetical protein